jgi:hypothetical protein
MKNPSDKVIDKSIFFYDQAIVFTTIKDKKTYLFYYLKRDDDQNPSTEDYYVFCVNHRKVNKLTNQDLRSWILNFKEYYLVKMSDDLIHKSIIKKKIKDITEDFLPDSACAILFSI